MSSYLVSNYGAERGTDKSEKNEKHDKIEKNDKNERTPVSSSRP